MKTLKKLIAEKLLKIKAVKLQPSNPFTWAMGWKSPIYCDNRKTLSHPQLRNFIKIELARIIREKYEQVDAIAGVATGAIAQGAMVAEELCLPFVYVRSSRSISNCLIRREISSSSSGTESACNRRRAAASSIKSMALSGRKRSLM
jgi:orotate phosphoribosyltransferase